MTDRDDAIKSFLGKLSVRDLRHMARGRKVDDYKTMKKKDLASTLFDKHFMQKRDKEKFAPVEKDEKENPVPVFATAPKGLARRGVRDYARGTIMAEGAPQKAPGLTRDAPSFTTPGATTVKQEMEEKKKKQELSGIEKAAKATQEALKKANEAARARGIQPLPKVQRPKKFRPKIAEEEPPSPSAYEEV